MMDAPVVASPDPQQIPFAKLVIDRDFQVRLQAYPAQIEHYRVIYQAGFEPMPPVLVALIGDTAILIDGHHRAEAQRRLGRSHIEAIVKEYPSLDEARWDGATANNRNGIPLTRNERRRRFALYLSTGRWCREGKPKKAMWAKSWNQMAKETSISPNSAKQWTKEMRRWLYEAIGAEDTNMHSGSTIRAPKGMSPSEQAERHLTNFLNYLPGIPTPEERGEMIERLRLALADLEQQPHTIGEF